MFHMLFTCLPNLFTVTFEPDIYIVACFSLKILLKTENPPHWPGWLCSHLISPTPSPRPSLEGRKGQGVWGGWGRSMLPNKSPP